jgi:hypothetical protein
MIDLQIFPSKDPSYLAMQGRANSGAVRVLMKLTELDKLDRLNAAIPDKRNCFARQNREVFSEIAQGKIARGEFELEGEARTVTVVALDFEGRGISDAPLNPIFQTLWVDLKTGCQPLSEPS